MEHNLFKNRGTRGFFLVTIGWPLIMMSTSIFCWGLYSIDRYIFNSSLLIPFGLTPLKVTTVLTCLLIGIYHYIQCRAWNSKLNKGEFGERLFFIRAEYFGIIPFSIGLNLLINWFL